MKKNYTINIVYRLLVTWLDLEQNVFFQPQHNVAGSPPVGLVGVSGIWVLQDQQQKLVHFQQEWICTGLCEEDGQQYFFLLSQSFLVIVTYPYKWVLRNTQISLNKKPATWKCFQPWNIKYRLTILYCAISGTLHSVYGTRIHNTNSCTLLRRSIVSDLREVRSCHRATQCFRQHLLRACRLSTMFIIIHISIYTKVTIYPSLLLLHVCERKSS